MTHYPERKESLWILTIGPSIWALHFLLSYTTAALWCGMVVGRSGSVLTARYAIAVYTAIALPAIAAAGWRGFRRNRSRTEVTPFDSDDPRDRYQFLGFASLLLSGLSLVATIYSGMAALLIDSCY